MAWTLTEKLDRLEKYAVVLAYAFLAWRLLAAYRESPSPVVLLYLADQLVVMVFLLLRRPSKQLSVRWSDWLFGVAGTFLPTMIVAPSGEPVLPGTAVILLILVGLLIHVYAKMSLRRSFGVVAANRGVKMEGPYRVVRHPMYLGYMVTQIGLLAAGPTGINAAIITACWVLFLLRIRAEEAVLGEDETYRALCAQTRWRLVPGIY